MEKNNLETARMWLVLKIVFIVLAFAFFGFAVGFKIYSGKVEQVNNQPANVVVIPEADLTTTTPEIATTTITSTTTTTTTGALGLANPASVNCTTQGGTLKIESRPDGAQYGVCYFEDNRQCEEWALFRGDCPVGGRRITGYATPAAIFCAITGGKYKVTKEYPEVASEKEEGTCILKAGQECDAQEFFDGTCPSI